MGRMRSWPSWLAVLLGAVAFLLGLFLNFNASVSSVNDARWFSLVAPLLIGGTILLAAGLHALQATYDSWCGCDDCMGGCDCCGDDCACGDCGSCGKGEANGHEGHDHDGGHDHPH
ncbi:MAG: hypothetical protein QOI63_213 [Thermoplasmata archaeon]|nr:hypothetical protein [Thermoplasmata archaeon]